MHRYAQKMTFQISCNHIFWGDCVVYTAPCEWGANTIEAVCPPDPPSMKTCNHQRPSSYCTAKSITGIPSLSEKKYCSCWKYQVDILNNCNTLIFFNNKKTFIRSTWLLVDVSQKMKNISDKSFWFTGNLHKIKSWPLSRTRIIQKSHLVCVRWSTTR